MMSSPDKNYSERAEIHKHWKGISKTSWEDGDNGTKKAKIIATSFTAVNIPKHLYKSRRKNF